MSAELKVLDCEPPTGDDAIQKLEQALEDAKAGRLASIAFATVYRDGSTGSGWSATRTVGTLLGAVTALQMKLARSLTE